MNTSEMSGIEDRGASRGFDEAEAEQHDHARDKAERVFDELAGDLVWRLTIASTPAGASRFRPGFPR